MLLHRVFLFTLVVFGSTAIRLVNSHQESGEWSCDPDSEKRVGAEFKPGIVTLDGRADDWEDIDGFEFSLLPALDPDAENEYTGGKMTIKVPFFNIYYSYVEIIYIHIYKFVMY